MHTDTSTRASGLSDLSSADPSFMFDYIPRLKSKGWRSEWLHDHKKQSRVDGIVGVQVEFSPPWINDLDFPPNWCVISNSVLCSTLWNDPDIHDALALQSPLLHVLIKTNVFADISSLSLAWLIASLRLVNTMSCIPIYSAKMNQRYSDLSPPHLLVQALVTHGANVHWLILPGFLSLVGR